MTPDRKQDDASRIKTGRKARRPRPARPLDHPGVDAKPDKPVSSAAFDEVFAALARSCERMRQSNARLHSAHEQHADDAAANVASAGQTPLGVGTIPRLDRVAEPALDPSPFRDLAQQMDRQRERLAQLLRDIEMGVADA